MLPLKLPFLLFLAFGPPKILGVVPLNDFFPFGPSHGDTNQTRGDDNSSPLIKLDQTFAFFGSNYTSLWVNTNGAFSFRTNISNYTPNCSPQKYTYSMIAPFWADVDITNTGNIYYRQSSDPSVLTKAKEEIANALPNFAGIKLTWAFIATWYEVPYFKDKGSPADNKTNTFQATLVSNGVQSFAIFYYNQITWTTGDASGGHNGTQAFAGFDDGDGTPNHRSVVPGSCTSGIINIAEMTNGHKPGVFVFQIDGPNITQQTTIAQTHKLSQKPASTKAQIRTPVVTKAPAPPLTTEAPSSLSNSDGSPCVCNMANMWLDVILVIDRSSAVGEDGLPAIGAQISSILAEINVAQSGPNDFYSRVGLIVYSSTPQIVADLTSFQNSDQLQNALFDLEKYYEPNDQISDLLSALILAGEIFTNQSSNQQRNVRKVILVYASSYNHIHDDPKTVAAQLNNSNIFTITMDYHDNSGMATPVLEIVATPYMNFSSVNRQDKEMMVDVRQALCWANCLCPQGMAQLKTFNATTIRQTYYADCFNVFGSGAFYTQAERACIETNGTLVSLTSQQKEYFVTHSVISKDSTLQTINSVHIGLHYVSGEWLWYGYNGTTYSLGTYQPWAPGYNADSSGSAAYINQYADDAWGWKTEDLSTNGFTYICQVHACDQAPRDCNRDGWILPRKTDH